MNMLTSWFQALDPTLRFYWGVAIFASIVFVIQTTLSFVGLGDVDSGDGNVDFNTETDCTDDAGAMHLLSIRNIFYFLLGFGWAGVSFFHTIKSSMMLGVLAVAVGCAFVGAFMFLFRMMLRLQSNGAFDINDAVGKVCNVYLRIPAACQGMGKVQISFNGSVQELDARTTDADPIRTGALVRVERVVENNVLEVTAV